MNILDEKFAEFQYNDQHDFTRDCYEKNENMALIKVKSHLSI